VIPCAQLPTGEQVSIRLAHFGQCRSEAVASDRALGGVLVSCATCGASVVLDLHNTSGPTARGIDPNNTKGA
jgi:hypothetical protein